MSEAVLTEVENGIMVVTINRPEAKNAVNLAVAKGIAAAMDELDSNPEIRVAILTGADNSFCAGMDLKAFVTGEMPIIPGKGFAGLCEASPKKPLIGAVEGYALAGGCELALSCDLLVVADNSKFGIPEAKRGLAAAAGGLMKLPRMIPSRIAMELALTGDFIDSARAYDLGLVNQVVPAGTTLEAAKALAAKIVANAPMSIEASKRVIMEQVDWSTEEMFAKQQAIVDPIFVSHDATEGAKAFAEKRAPNWLGK
ncbi:crotonase/enoyl-CoA hydratase family protein [Spongiibacter sp. KMU-158]|uniref:Crotonase/enoyl-CoA hydratase family protein n=1 Tax=Spongiibacter pelagi TaxID=2760804 RepID=A0A927C1M0_9GAMM|nr:crotonase/enoyl-CoA hydratase family protein [Spongiibacter pelagi]MBD2859619.1 crotonase/enoyl-CoA hydratase family protein [Spongiibacter pelagi]